MNPRNFRRISGYDRTASVSVPAGSAGTVIMSERLSGNAALLITHFGNYVSDIAAWGAVSWTPRINGIAVPGLERTMDQLGDPSRLRELAEPFLIRGGDLFEVVATNSSGTPYGVGVSLQGRYGAVRV